MKAKNFVLAVMLCVCSLFAVPTHASEYKTGRLSDLNVLTEEAQKILAGRLETGKTTVFRTGEPINTK